ncbi:MAG: ABC transporter ATP-binding protein [Labilithrix sp.]|nr:ABC transporter ATP-binding protein [Labilithrix sp.]MCW5833123.1 ABC transporter ATP-binding protein [Labilithrix sp.]
MTSEPDADDVAAVRVQNVVKRVRDGSTRRTVLDDVSFDVRRGELVIVRGPSGSGKTTLLAIVGAMLSPTSGEVHVDGEPTSRLREGHRAEIRRRKVGFVFQDLQLLDGLTALRNVLLPCVPDGVTSADEARARALLEQRGLGALADSKAKGLSGGERQRVALCRALLRDPKLLVLDEPTAHLDDANAVAIAEELAALAREGRALLVATHDARIAKSAGVSRVLDLAGGKVVGQGPDAPPTP